VILDYSYARPDPAAMRGAGAIAVMRYLSPTPAKNLSAAERDALHAAGLGIGLVWESTAARAGAGYAAGLADARAAEAQAAALGYPAGCPIFYAVDYAAAVAAVLPYFQGVAAAAVHPLGVYGSAAIVEGVPAPWKWQTAAWSAGRISPAAHLYQQAVGSPVAGTDINDLRAALPLWGPITTASDVIATTGGLPSAPPAPDLVPPTLQETDMIVIKQTSTGKTFTAAPGLLKHHADGDQLRVALLLCRQTAPLELNDDDTRRAVWDLGIDNGADPIARLAALPQGGTLRA